MNTCTLSSFFFWTVDFCNFSIKFEAVCYSLIASLIVFLNYFLSFYISSCVCSFLFSKTSLHRFRL